MSFTRTQQKCEACGKTVYPVELLSADGIDYHKSCFKCSHSKRTLKENDLLGAHSEHMKEVNGFINRYERTDDEDKKCNWK